MEETIKLTPIDLLMPRGYIRFNFHFSLTLSNQAATPTHLELSFSRLLKEIPLLGGFIHQREDTTLEIRLLPNHPRHSFHIRDFTKDPTATAAQYAPVEWAIQGKADAPVSAAQANFTSDGLVLCICMHHAITDGPGLATVVRRWSEHCHDVANSTNFAISRPLSKECCDRTPLLNQGIENTALTHLAEDMIKKRDAQGYDYSLLPGLAIPDMPVHIFRIDEPKLAELKGSVDAYIKAVDASKWVSTHDVLCAYLWHSISRARARVLPALISDAGSVEGKKTSRLITAANMRAELIPPLPADYMGNANVHPLAKRPLKCLTSTVVDALAGTAVAIRKSITDTDDAYARNLCHVIEHLPPWDVGKVNNPVCDFEAHGEYDIDITSWLTFGVRDMDWGSKLGRPGKMRRVVLPGQSGLDGRCGILPRTSEGGMEVMVSLKEESMRALMKDEFFKGMASLGSW
ncbi:uncharacterized protein KY384_007517 [Bacidia gigantensis]|uniref:uncharacterized protein n=1 Tax=Bacidia gigantensis TaxID=2732470 RepID=UPI001D04C2B7|nr:uncharacterized protein KY384_007517 [Bacidia gigantensis]KAG8527365.1 hypothetical protein KY384_007517 [Bacidia gigantensis]